ncbi:MAG TPA: sigma-70 family RNA polymerase sigma factor [Candidatus Atopostipes pullistercoris]|uniref:Sigma-70 family RNA polymerase sigma factor n=1 Tax=Candidatus Atopostipes pullistercoris TaxID=2838467 RepID=A0A9D2JY66_9LACT|nr:sigma-70 family RNA polymerase sigma factor [Candidatus Atopostipes pullistercoris]
MRGVGHLNIPELLVMIIQSIKEDPFERLVKVSEPITYSVINRYFFPEYETEDLLQEARGVLLRSVEAYHIDEEMPFLQYYHMCLTNRFNQLLRKSHANKRKVHLETTSLDELMEEAGPHIQGTSSNFTYPEEAAMARETYSNYLIELSPFEKEVFFLFIEGHTRNEIAEELGIALRKVQNALHRCQIKLRTAINK